jgi:hypothetical protein
VTRSNLSPRTPRPKEILPLPPDSVREARLAAPRSDHGLNKLDSTANHFKSSAELPNENVNVIDDLTGGIPITNQELDVIETYLGSLLEALPGEK